VNSAEARRSARSELADHAARLAEIADETAGRNARDVEGARDAVRMAAAYRAVATLLDPVAFPPPARTRVPPGALSLVTPDGVPIEEMARG
jgi:hypothetical protein